MGFVLGTHGWITKLFGLLPSPLPTALSGGRRIGGLDVFSVYTITSSYVSCQQRAFIHFRVGDKSNPAGTEGWSDAPLRHPSIRHRHFDDRIKTEQWTFAISLISINLYVTVCPKIYAQRNIYWFFSVI